MIRGMSQSLVPEDVKPHHRLPSLRLLITLIVVIPIAVVSIALVSIASVTSLAIADQLGDEFITSATDRVMADVNDYLGRAVRISDVYEQRLYDGTLSPNDLGAWRRMMFQDLKANPDIASICFATPSGNCTWLLRAHGRLELGYAYGKPPWNAKEWQVNEKSGEAFGHPLREYDYDATERPWFKAALAASPNPTWTEIYFWFPGQGEADVTGSGYTRVVRDPSGNLLGVLIIDVTLAALSDHLQENRVDPTSKAFLVDEKGMLVAASDGPVSAKGARLSPADSDNAAARAIAPLVAVEVHGPEVKAKTETAARVIVDSAPHRALVTEIKPWPGVHWHVVSMLPESAFLSQVQKMRHRAILLAGGAIIGGLALGLYLSKRLSSPLETLTFHVARVGGGDFDSRLNLTHAAELHRLSDEVNKMAGGLKHRMMLQHSISVATQVQQSLLPTSLPSLEGLQLAACSKYCESTGGDYYDFIEMPGREGHHTLIAVGDVTSHGIGAAMLMATARGAVRAAAEGAPSLGHVLTRANQVLTGSVNQGMFMTLSLLCVNSQTGWAHWSSAGHDPVCVYHPDTDEFEELTGGDIPLGIESEVVYREFSRKCASPGTIFLVGTDGIWEARNHQGKMFGKDRLRVIMRDNSSSAEQLSNAIKAAMSAWLGELAIQDDVTFVIIKVCAASQ